MVLALRRRIRTMRKPALVCYDIAIWLVALGVAGLAYEAVDPGSVTWPGILVALAAAITLQLMLTALVGQQHRHAPIGGRDDLVLQAGVTATAGTWAAIAHFLPGSTWLPFAVPLVATVIAVVLALVGRIVWALLRDRFVAHRVAGGGARRTIVVGDGYAGRHLVRAMQRDVKARYLPIGFLASGPEHKGRQHSKVRVLGTEDDLVRVLRRTGASTLVIALPRDRPTHMRQLQMAGRSMGVDVLTLPAADELDGQQISVHHLRDVDDQLRVLAGSYESQPSIAPAVLHRMTGL